MNKLPSSLFSNRFNKNFQLNDAVLIGQGNFAQVYKLFDSDLKRQFAFRRVQKIESQIDDIYKEKAINQTLKKISSQHLLGVYDIIDLEKEIIYICQYCQGGSLWDSLNEMPDCKIEQRETCRIMLQICKGIQDLHHHKITHRDLKPQNILLTRKYNKKKEFPDIKIADFGLSTTKLIMNTVAGTKEYLSPEQARFCSYTNAVDVWAMGIIFDQLLHGTTFYTGEDNKQVFNNICNVPYYVRDQSISLQVKQVLVSMLKKRPYQRPIISDIVLQLNNFLNGVKIKVLKPISLNNVPVIMRPLITDCWEIQKAQLPLERHDRQVDYELRSTEIKFRLQIQPKDLNLQIPVIDPQIRYRMLHLNNQYSIVSEYLKGAKANSSQLYKQARQKFKCLLLTQVEKALSKSLKDV